ncbi:MAG TPA: hypothetical protein PLD46_08335, partial [Hyphomicrobium sp.]|nr:hypothetical protein [Hyphomicrobium sp.]
MGCHIYRALLSNSPPHWYTEVVHMAFRMARPTRRSGSAHNQFRKRVPNDIVGLARGRRASVSLPAADDKSPEVVVAFSIGHEVRFSLQTHDGALTRKRHAAASDQLERLFAAYRLGERPVLQKERVALAGLIYHDWAQSFEDAPGEPEIWRLIIEANNRAATSEESMEKWFGQSVDELLARQGVIPDQASRKAIVHEVARAMNEAASKLRKNAEGDYQPDPVAARFPKWNDATSKTANADRGRRSNGDTITALFLSWQKHPDQETVAPSTLASYASVFAKLGAFLEQRYGCEPEAAKLG